MGKKLKVTPSMHIPVKDMKARKRVSKRTKERNKRKHKHNEHCTFACPYDGCSAVFQWAWSLKAHVLTHEQGMAHVEKAMIKCHKCPKQFYTEDCLKNHLRSHTTKNFKFPCTHPGCTKKY